MEKKLLKLKIVSDGTSEGSRVEDEDGRFIPGVQRVVFMADANQVYTKAVIEVINLPIEIEQKCEIQNKSNIEVASGILPIKV